MMFTFLLGMVGLLKINAQLTVEAHPSEKEDKTFAYYTKNILVGGLSPQTFALSFNQDDASTLSWGTQINDTHVENIITTPRIHWKGKFKIETETNIQTLAFSQLAYEKKGVAWCDGILVEGTQRWPAACTSEKAVHARCTRRWGCRYAASVDNNNHSMVLARADPHAKSFDNECTLQITLENGIRACADKDAVFNPVEAGASIIQKGEFQTLYFNRRADNGPAGAVFVIIIILCLVLWVKNMQVYEDGTNASKITTISWGVSDLSVTVASASIFAIAEGGTAFIPPEIELLRSTGPPQLWFGLYIVVIMGGGAIASAAAFRRSTLLGKSPLTNVVRFALEVQLLTALHFHLPTVMGIALRRTVGFFVGEAALVIIGRDFPRAAMQINIVPVIIMFVWVIVAVTYICMVLLLPVVAQSAGVADDTAVEFALALETATLVFAVVRLS